MRSVEARTHRGRRDIEDLRDFARLEALRRFRSRIAAGRPAYTVFSNETLELLARFPPSDRESFLSVKGLGPGRWDKFGADLLAELGAPR